MGFGLSPKAIGRVAVVASALMVAVQFARPSLPDSVNKFLG